jgi:hypothetical protein
MHIMPQAPAIFRSAAGAKILQLRQTLAETVLVSASPSAKVRLSNKCVGTFYPQVAPFRTPRTPKKIG